MADKENGEDILRAILEKGSDKAKKAAADALTQHPPTPADPPEVKAKKRRKGLKKALAAKIGNSKYYHDAATGAIVDEQGQPAPKRIAEQLVKEKVAPAARKTQSIPELARLKKELSGIGKVTAKSIQTNNNMVGSATTAFEQFQSVLSNFSTQNSQLLDAMVQQNADFHEKVIEAITGIKAPTKSSGSTKSSPIPKATPKKSKISRAPTRQTGGSKYQKRVAAMTPAQKKAQQDRVQARAEHIGAIRAKKTVATIAKTTAVGAIGGAVVGSAVGALAGVQRTQPSGPSAAELNARKLGPEGGTLPTQPAQTRVEQEKAQPPAGAPQRMPEQPPSGGAGGGGGIEEVARRMLAVHEGRRNTPYKDSKGLWTVGIGHLIGDGRSLPPEMNRTFSDAEVDELFSKDYKHHAAAAANIPGYNQINDMGKVALIDLTFNMGQVWYKKWPNFCKAMGEGNWQQAANSLEQSAWYRQVGRRAPTIVGLIRNGGSAGGAIGTPSGGAVAGAGGAGGGVITPPPAPMGGADKLGPEKRTALSAAKAANEAAAAGAPTGGPPALAPPTPGAGMAAGDKTGQNGMLPPDRLASVGVGQHKAQPVAADAFKAMRAAAAADKVDLGITDSYRSYAAQVDVKRRKPNLAATPGKSNHGWGLAFDMSFGSNMNTPGYKWMVQNAAKFGFKGPLQRPFEAWHWEYVGGGNPEAIKAGGAGATEMAAGAPAGAPGAAPTTAVQGAQMANASAERALMQGSAPAGGQTIIMNNTRTINNTRIMHQPGSSLPNFNRGGGFNPLQMVAGALIGKAVSRLF
jgi:GH24 family phage-related lysozyme (muramidase)